MEVLEVSSAEYLAAIQNPSHIFNSVPFAELNKQKCEKVLYLLFKDTKVRLGIIFGLRNNILTSPFSAPFGGFEAVSQDIKLQQIESALEKLDHWTMEHQYEGIRIVFPPFFYNSNTLNKVYNALIRNGYSRTNVDLNYQFSTKKFTEQYVKSIWYNAQKNLKRSFSAGLTFEKLPDTDGHLAYEVIALNRKSRGFPLRMSLEDVLSTASVIKIDYFLVKKEQTKVGAAVVFHVAKDIVQVVYWGDVPDYMEYKTMNFLSYHVFDYYAKQNLKIIDIGPSTENSVPNYGLCEFKESIGCDILIKTEFTKKFDYSASGLQLTKLSEDEKPLKELTASAYYEYFAFNRNPFVKRAFIELNSHKVDSILYLVPDDDKVQIGLVAGLRNNILLAPFSAPFGGFHFKGEQIYTSAIDSFLKSLLAYLEEKDIAELHLTLPPNIYSESSNAKIVGAFTRLGVPSQHPDITNYVDLREFQNHFTNNASRTYYNQAVKKSLSFSQTHDLEEQRIIYQIIKENRSRMGRPIFMTFENVKETSAVFATDFFTVRNINNEITAGAIFYRDHPEIVYALFWGDSQHGRQDRAMDFLIFNLWSHYKSLGYHYIDLGISTESGVPNEGLLRFKETHECKSSLRYTFVWKSSTK